MAENSFGYSHKLRLKDDEILHRHYEELLLSGEDHDLILKVKDKEFRVHRNIMKCRCPVFKSMLVHDMLERNSGIVEIPDCDPCEFEQFLFYVYTANWKTVDNSIMSGSEDDEILHRHYEELLLSGEDHDLILKVKDKEFRVHRNIMKCRCPVFKCMLVHDMLERNSGIAEIPDCDPCAFEQFLFYVYTGNWKTVDTSIMSGLYYIADKYDMENLKEKCSEFITRSLSAHTVSDVIKLASNHSDTLLLDCAAKYFVENAKNVLVTVEWQLFMKENPLHVNELFLKVIDNCSCHLPKEKSEKDLTQSLHTFRDLNFNTMDDFINYYLPPSLFQGDADPVNSLDSWISELLDSKNSCKWTQSP